MFTFCLCKNALCSKSDVTTAGVHYVCFWIVMHLSFCKLAWVVDYCVSHYHHFTDTSVQHPCGSKIIQKEMLEHLENVRRCGDLQSPFTVLTHVKLFTVLQSNDNISFTPDKHDVAQYWQLTSEACMVADLKKCIQTSKHHCGLKKDRISMISDFCYVNYSLFIQLSKRSMKV